MGRVDRWPGSPTKKTWAESRNSARQLPYSPARQACWSVGPIRRPKRASPRPVPKKTPRAYFSIPHTLCLRSPPTQSLPLHSLSAISFLCARFSSTHVVAGHHETHRPPRRRRWPYPLLFSSTLTSTTSLAISRKQRPRPPRKQRSHRRTAIGGRFRPPRPPRR